MIVKSEIIQADCIYSGEGVGDGETSVLLMLTETDDGERQITFGTEEDTISFSLEAVKELERRMDENENQQDRHK